MSVTGGLIGREDWSLRVKYTLGYSINQEKYLRKFLCDGDIPMDNNPAERAIHPFTIGRKNFVLIESDHGAKASAMIYSLVETAKANNLNTYKYLEMLLTVIPNHMNDTNLDFIEALLPWSSVVQQECQNQNNLDHLFMLFLLDLMTTLTKTRIAFPLSCSDSSPQAFFSLPQRAGIPVRGSAIPA